MTKARTVKKSSPIEAKEESAASFGISQSSDDRLKFFQLVCFAKQYVSFYASNFILQRKRICLECLMNKFAVPAVVVHKKRETLLSNDSIPTA